MAKGASPFAKCRICSHQKRGQTECRFLGSSRFLAQRIFLWKQYRRAAYIRARKVFAPIHHTSAGNIPRQAALSAESPRMTLRNSLSPQTAPNNPKAAPATKAILQGSSSTGFEKSVFYTYPPPICIVFSTCSFAFSSRDFASLRREILFCTFAAISVCTSARIFGRGIFCNSLWLTAVKIVPEQLRFKRFCIGSDLKSIISV